MASAARVSSLMTPSPIAPTCGRKTGCVTEGADIRRVVLEQELKREYQMWLQERNRGRPDSDGRPDRDEREIERWANEHDLPYFDNHVHFLISASSTSSMDAITTRMSRSSPRITAARTPRAWRAPDFAATAVEAAAADAEDTRRANRPIQDRVGDRGAEGAWRQAGMEVVQLDGADACMSGGIQAHQPALA